MSGKKFVVVRPEDVRTTYTSYAIACVKDDKILFIRRTGTYPFTSLFGYGIEKLNMDLHFFDRMTEKEKRRILDPEFDYVSCYRESYSNKLRRIRASARTSHEAERIEEKIHRMETQAHHSFRAIIRRKKHLIEDSLAKGLHGSFPYSLPKGRRSSEDQNEGALQTALREFSEETGIPHHKVKVVSRNSFNLRYIDDGDEYLFRIFFAQATDDVHGILDKEDHEQAVEVSEISWMSKADFEARSPAQLCRRVYLENFDRLMNEYRLARDGYRHGTDLVIDSPPANPRQREHLHYAEPEDPCAMRFGSHWRRREAAPPQHPLRDARK